MKTFIYSLMTDQRKGIVFVPFKTVLFALSLAYALAIFIRKLLYGAGIFKSEEVPLKVISVGNLTLGGTGKTPFVVALSNILKNDLKKDASILIRGYGWDEQAMLKQNLPDTPVIVGEDRVKSAHRAIKLYGNDTAVLDDGFQHWELKRALDIVLIDSRNPFGNGRLFPRGILREGKAAIARAHVIVFTKVNKKNSDLDAIKKELISINKDLIFLEAFHKPRSFFESRSKKTLDTSMVRARKAILVSSIGDPVYFEETVKDLGVSVVEHVKFPDHHNYSEPDIARIMTRCNERSFDFIITTEKDAVKFNRMSFSFGDNNILTLAVEMEIVSGKEDLVDRLHSLYNRKAS